MTGDTLPDSELGPLLAPTKIQVASDYQAALRSHYRTCDFVTLIGTPPALWDVQLGGDVPLADDKREAITHAWWQIVSGHVGGYVKYRLDSFADVLGMHAAFRGTTVLPRHWQNKTNLETFGISHADPPLAKTAESIAQWTGRRTPAVSSVVLRAARAGAVVVGAAVSRGARGAAVGIGDGVVAADARGHAGLSLFALVGHHHVPRSGTARREASRAGE